MKAVDKKIKLETKLLEKTGKKRFVEDREQPSKNSIIIDNNDSGGGYTECLNMSNNTTE